MAHQHRVEAREIGGEQGRHDAEIDVDRSVPERGTDVAVEPHRRRDADAEEAHTLTAGRRGEGAQARGRVDVLRVDDHHSDPPVGRDAQRVEHVRVVAAVCTVSLYQHGTVDARSRRSRQVVLGCHRVLTEPLGADARRAQREARLVARHHVHMGVDDHDVTIKVRTGLCPSARAR
jgi:hypothetical protein